MGTNAALKSGFCSTYTVTDHIIMTNNNETKITDTCTPASLTASLKATAYLHYDPVNMGETISQVGEPGS